MFSLNSQLLPAAIVGGIHGGANVLFYKSAMDKKLLYVVGLAAGSEAIAGMLSQTIEKPLLGFLPASSYTPQFARAASSGAIYALLDKFVMKSGQSFVKAFLIQAGSSFSASLVGSSLSAAYA